MSGEHWLNFCREELGLGEHEDFAKRWWNDVLEKHLRVTETRPYHNLTHVAELLTLAKRHCGEVSAPMGLAIYFHDVIYEPQVGSNEERSAQLFKMFASEAKQLISASWCDQARVEDVYAWIIETSHHITSTYISPFDQDQFLLFLDFDMAILGSNPERYQQYCRDVRKEYSHVPDDQFAKGRAAFLTSVLKTEDARLFRTEKIRSVCLQQARENIKWELALLQNGHL